MYMHAKSIRVRSQVVLVNFQILFSILFEKMKLNERRGSEIDVYDEKKIFVDVAIVKESYF